jgi:hypothetical protein
MGRLQYVVTHAKLCQALGHLSNQKDMLINFVQVAVDDSFILYLLEIIEGVSDDAQDPYHYPVIRILV